MKRHPVRWTWTSLACGLLALTLCVTPGHGQLRAKKVGDKASGSDEPKYTDAVTLPRNPESRRLIEAAEAYVAKKEWRIALGECLQPLLETPEDSFIEVTRKDDEGRDVTLKVSVRAEANRIIGSLPTEGQEAYQLQFGQSAQDRLNEAIAKADPAILAEVSQRYQHTKAGLEATQLLGTYHLDRGQHLMASLCFERMLARPDADQVPPKVLFRAALAARRSGNTAAAQKLWAKFTEKLGRSDLTLGRVQLTPDKVRAEYERELGGDALAALFDWPIFRGNAGRSAQGQGSTAFLEPRWTANTIRTDKLLDPMDKGPAVWIEQYLDLAVGAMRDKPIIPANFAVAANGRLLVRGYDGVSAFAMKPMVVDGEEKHPGDLLWRQDPEFSLFTTIRDDIHGKKKATEDWYNLHYRTVGPAGVFFENSVTGSLSHDGQRAYFIDDLAVPPHPNQLVMMGPNGQVGGFGTFTDQVYHNRLYTVDLESGKLTWSPLGGRTKGGSKPADSTEKRTDLNAATELQDSFFLGPPLPLGGKLYLLVEKNAELRLVCLDANKLVVSALNPQDRIPELVWVQSLGTAQQKLPNDGLRRLQAAHLAYGDGILVCPTNAGAVLGVDLLSHSLVWAYSYRKVQQMQSPDEMMIMRGRIRQIPPSGPTSGERWRASAPTIVKGKVVITSHDGSEVHCLSLRDGRPLWTVKRNEANDLYLAGVFEDRVLIVAKNHVRALQLDTGKDAWEKQPVTGMPSGQGVAAEGIYYLPLATSADPKSSDKGPEVCAIDVKTGQVVGRSKSHHGAPGNLLFMEGDLVSQTVKTVSAFPLLKVRQAEISAQLAKNPNDPTGLTERGELHLYNGDVRAAVADLRNALRNQPPESIRAKTREKLYEALTALLQSDFAAGEPYLKDYEDLCGLDLPDKTEHLRRRAAFLELLGKGRERQGRVLEAFAAYEQYGELSGHKELVDSLDEPNTRSRPDIWSRGRIQALMASAKPEDRQKLEDEISKRWESARASKELDPIRKFVSIFGSASNIGPAARLELTRRLLAEGGPEQTGEAERNLALLCYTGSERRGDAAAAVQALDLMIKVCVDRGQFESAVGYYRQMAENFPDTPVRDGRTGKQLYDELITDKRFVPYLETPTTIWSGPLTGRKQPRQGVAKLLSISLDPTGPRSAFFDRHRVTLDVAMDGRSGWTLRVLDRASGADKWKVDALPNADYLLGPGGPWAARFAFVHGHLLVMQLNNYVYAFDLAERREVWKHSLYGKDKVMNSQHQRMVFDPNVGVSVISPEERQVVLGRIAAVESTYVALQNGDKLVVLDPTRPGPSVMWVKEGVPASAKVFGDEQYLFVLDTDATRGQPVLRAFSAQDGGVMPIPNQNLASHWSSVVRTVGRRLLIAETEGAIRLHDAATAKETWRREFARGRVVVKSDDARFIGAVEPGGLFTLLDARTGAVRFTSRLKPEHAEKLQEAYLLADRDRYYLTLNQTPADGHKWKSAASYSIRAVPLNGPVYALNRRTGKLEWECNFVPHQTLLMDQWADLPVLLFASAYNRTSPSGMPERQSVKVTAVDKSSGKLVFDEELLNLDEFFALRASPALGRIELERTDLVVVLSTPDAVALPAPPPSPARAPAGIAPPPLMVRPARAMPVPAPGVPMPRPAPPVPQPKGG